MMMQQSAILNRGTSYRRNRNFQSGRLSTAALGPVSTTLLLVVIVGVLALLYLTQITKTSVYGYEVSTLGAERQVLIERQQELEAQAARLQSIARVRSAKVVGSLQPEQNPSFSNSGAN